MSAIDADNILRTLGTRPVVTLFSSDGDALFFQADRGFSPFFVWEQVQDQKFAWETNPILSELAPLIWNYYMETRSQVSFMSGLSGAGYCYPQRMSPDQLTAYLQRTARYLNNTGLRVVRFDGRLGPWDENFAIPYYEILKNSGYLGAILAFRPDSPYGTSLQYLGTPAPALKPTYTIMPSNKDEIVNDLISRDPAEIFVKFAGSNNTSEITTVDDDSATNGRAMLVAKAFFNSPSYSLAFSAGPMTLMPGSYEVKHRLKVTDNTSSGVIARVFVGKRFAFQDYTILNTREIRANDFQQPDRYEEFSYTFDVDELTPDVEFRLDYGDGSSDLYADYIRITNNSPASLPVFAPLYLSLAVDPSEHDGMKALAKDFTENFESQGGIVLTPDEFFAALNPEFMINFGSTLLGENDSNILEAKQQLENGDYLGSLLTVRKALLPVSGVAKDRQIPGGFILHQNYPNPFNLSTTITFDLPNSAKVSVKIYDVFGRKVSTLTQEILAAGFHSINWDGRNSRQQIVASGLYLYEVATQSQRKVGKALLIK